MFQGREESEVEQALRKAIEEEAEEQRRQRGEDPTLKKQDSKQMNEIPTFDMFATDAELPPEVCYFCISCSYICIENFLFFFIRY